MRKKILFESVAPIKGDKVIVVFNSENGTEVINLPLLTAEFPLNDSVGVWKIKNRHFNNEARNLLSDTSE